MAEYIERGKFLKECVKTFGNTGVTIKAIEGIANECTADAVDVVRCKDCKHLMFSDFYGECSMAYLGIVSPNDYCSYGKRKEQK